MSSPTATYPTPVAARGAAPLTFARRRLRLGITGVGATVVLSSAWLGALGLGLVAVSPFWRIVEGPAGVPITAALLAASVFVAHALVMFPIEHAGGRIAVRHEPSLKRWLAEWGRGVAVLGVLGAASLAMVAAAGAFAGTWAAAAASLAIATVLLSAQGAIARAAAPLALRRPTPAERVVASTYGIDPDRVRVVRVDDEAFVGGWVGPLGAPQLWIPAHWLVAAPDVAAVQYRRRQAQLASGARTRGWLAAAVWPSLGLLLLVPLLPWTWQDARLWLALPAVSSLWSFVAVLVLPTASRPATYRADASAARTLGAERVAVVIGRLDAWQDDESERTPWVERVFHPVPSAGNRRRTLAHGTPTPGGGSHQLTRLSLFASLAGGSLLGRMVHCNIGRPSLWFVYPGD